MLQENRDVPIILELFGFFPLIFSKAKLRNSVKLHPFTS